MKKVRTLTSLQLQQQTTKYMMKYHPNCGTRFPKGMGNIHQ